MKPSDWKAGKYFLSVTFSRSAVTTSNKNHQLREGRCPWLAISAPPMRSPQACRSCRVTQERVMEGDTPNGSLPVMSAVCHQ